MATRHKGKTVARHVKLRSLELVMGGKSVNETAKQLGVSGMSVNNWLRAMGTTAKKCRMPDFVPPRDFKKRTPEGIVIEPEAAPTIFRTLTDPDEDFDDESDDGQMADEGPSNDRKVPQVAALMRKPLDDKDPTAVVRLMNQLAEGMDALAKEQADVLDEGQLSLVGVFLRQIKTLTIPGNEPPINSMTDLKALVESFLKVTGRDQKMTDGKGSRIDPDILDGRFRVVNQKKKRIG